MFISIYNNNMPKFLLSLKASMIDHVQFACCVYTNNAL